MSQKTKGKHKLSVVVIGHVDSGKSTTTGHLVQLAGGVDKRTMEKLEKEAAERGKESFKFAYLMDRTAKERERGITIEAAVIAIETEKVSLTVIDAPGHKDFIKNMITGTSSADVAILVIPASQGEFETAISEQGQAREHATLTATMGVKTLLVGVNKMDTIEKDLREKRFREIKEEVVNNVLKKVGYKPSAVAVIPISGWLGWNLVEKSPETPWFEGYEYEHPTPSGPVKMCGHTVYDWINNLIPPVRHTEKPLRIPTDATYKISGIGTVGTGNVSTGILKPGDTIVACPANFATEVKSVEMHRTALEFAQPGDSIGFNIKNVSVQDLTRGNVVGHLNNHPPCVAKRVLAQTMIVAPPGTKDVGSFHKGYTPICDAHTAHFPMRVEGIKYKFDKRTGKKIENVDGAPVSFLKKNDGAFIEFVPTKEVCLESFGEFPGLGRGVCREGNKTVAVFVIKEVLEKGDPPTGKGGAAKGGQKAAVKGKK